ncbi:UDP-2,4-diacetamido-2,4,6-trideoxy-beta-L-altropyranose hydrolase [Variovorax sp. J22G21]|uniref:UDP-2,4-diacetamido-2,4, 6-trideoxy-beta-L-altropyranose hydrolase n=1 Tax=Variovorax fucosicus TaxID=3053517 RepID=UPI002578D287|nr:MULTISPECIES: UDP-2,4-diacetamido-2,4,6-trideoxy-beta-L-altropyranose hydrolase [unclassified Variovorax]MDM0039461.1 UDP-2,4-diacetamido-2,4,6-trideoxy-beta-L-altropyranose hydrolase [Variovorax sp. J22R193]MDM0064236.1 UDP-2,4-diacetamido-2,4,6-trideoxy-beta-L-altropyranose hydrolase [Variovorax sp. J22G21]
MTDLAGATVVFRADASLQIGTGHVMRCLALASALKERGAQCRFVSRAHVGHLLEYIGRQGYEVATLPLTPAAPVAVSDTTAHAGWLGCDWQTDAQQTIVALGGRRTDWIVVDHYALDGRWEVELHAHAAHMLAIDDLADRSHRCELLVDQNLGRQASDYERLVSSGCRVLAGPRFALLRREFAALRERSLQRRTEPVLRHLLITMGGVDQPNATESVLHALQRCDLPPDCRLSVVMGAAAPWLESVRVQAGRMPWPTEVLVDVDDMAQRMVDSDLAIGAAGGTAWERCCLGLPTLLVVLADNQVSGARALEACGAAVLLGDANSAMHSLSGILSRLLRGDELDEMADAASCVTDGRGVARVLAEMVTPDV